MKNSDYFTPRSYTPLGDTQFRPPLNATVALGGLQSHLMIGHCNFILCELHHSQLFFHFVRFLYKFTLTRQHDYSAICIVSKPLRLRSEGTLYTSNTLFRDFRCLVVFGPTNSLVITQRPSSV